MVIACRHGAPACIHNVVYLAAAIHGARDLGDIRRVVGCELSGASRHGEDSWVARRQYLACDGAGSSRVRSNGGGTRDHWLFTGCVEASPAEFNFVAAAGELLRVLRAATGGAQFPVAQPDTVARAERMGGCWIDRSDFCRVSLAESGARTTDICRRSGHGVDVWARAKRHSACDWTSPIGSACGVGVSNGLAPPYARRAGVLRMAAVS